ncbi:MAG TPA: DUF3500 domain-containing protein [Kofleriaceae bacterium]|nr:DUF3500 domain-containing protein [Kofleriaceae bacterium]
MDRSFRKLLMLCVAAGCGGSSATPDGAIISSDGALNTDAAKACAAKTTQLAKVACAANAFLDTLSTSERTTAALALTDYVSRSKWNNLPVQMKPRAGLQLAGISATSQAAALDLLQIALSEKGHATVTGLLRADDYLGTMQSGYGSSLYSLAIVGTPSESSDFEIMFGGHHMAYNLNFVGGAFFPTPQHLGAEPKASFEFNGATYAPMVSKGAAMFAIYEALSASERTSAYLSGQSFNDVVVTPDMDYGKGQSRSSKSAYPTGSNRKGMLVSAMSDSQRALVTVAIEEWARQYPAEVADPLMAAYVAGYDDTYFAWGGAAAGPNADTSGSYLRIDGPRVWIELVVQGGIIIRNTTHYHSIYRDKTGDYGGQF